MLASSVSLTELARHGAGALEHYRSREHPPGSALEWLGLAVGRLPDLSARARTADEIAWRSFERAPQLHTPLLESLEEEIAAAAALVEAALDEHLRAHPQPRGEVAADADGYARMVAGAHHAAPRRAEFLVGGYTAFLSGAIEAGGALAEAEAAAGGRRWPRGDHEGAVALRAGQVYDALVNALGGLLAYARLTAAGPPHI